MAYEKTTWAAGDKVTAAKLNNIEQGIVNATPFLVKITSDVCDKTWQEIVDALADGQSIIFYDGDLDSGSATFWEISAIAASPYSVALYSVGAGGSITQGFYAAVTADDYPTLDS